MFSPDGKTLATGGADGTVSLWDPEAGRRIGTLDHPHTGPGSEANAVVQAFEALPPQARQDLLNFLRSL